MRAIMRNVLGTNWRKYDKLPQATDLHTDLQPPFRVHPFLERPAMRGPSRRKYARWSVCLALKAVGAQWLPLDVVCKLRRAVSNSWNTKMAATVRTARVILVLHEVWRAS